MCDTLLLGSIRHGCDGVRVVVRERIITAIRWRDGRHFQGRRAGGGVYCRVQALDERVSQRWMGGRGGSRNRTLMT
jgi:hypothetical protein